MLAFTSTTEEHVMTDARGKPELPTAFEMLESVVLLISEIHSERFGPTGG